MAVAVELTVNQTVVIVHRAELEHKLCAQGIWYGYILLTQLLHSDSHLVTKNMLWEVPDLPSFDDLVGLVRHGKKKL